MPGSLQSRYQGRAGVVAAGIFARNAKQAGADENFHAGHHFQIKIAGCLEYKAIPHNSKCRYGEREKSPEARLKEKDKRRAAYYRFYTDMNWGNAANYHIALDSGVIGIEKSAEIIESLA